MRLWVAPVFADRYVFGTYYVAIALISWYWGLAPAAVCAVAGYVIADAVLFRAAADSGLGSHPDVFEFFGYWLISGTLIGLIVGLRTREAALRQTLADERAVRARLASVKAVTGTFEWEWDLASDRVRRLNGQDSCLSEAPQRLTALKELIVPEDLPAVESAVERALAAPAASLTCAFRLRRSGCGAPSWLELRGVVHREDDGRATRVTGLAIDITERQQALEAVSAAEQRFKVALAASDVVAWACDAERRYTWVYNPARGFRSEDFIGRPLASLLPRETYAEYADAVDRVWTRGQGERLPVTWQHEGVERHYVSTIEPMKDANGRVAGLIGASVDVTALRQVEAAERSASEKLARTFQASPDGLAVSRVDDGTVLEVNSALLQMLDLRREDVVGARFSDLGLIDPADRAALVRQVEAGAPVRDVELAVRGQSGRRRTVLLSIVPLDGAETPVHTVLNIVRDVTALREAESAGRLQGDWLKLATDGAHLGTWMTNLETGHTECNGHNRVLFDLPADESAVPNDLWSARIHPDDRAGIHEAWERAAATHAPYEATYRVVWRDGKVRWIESRARFHPAFGAFPARAYGISMDITDRKQAEQAALDAARRKDEFLATLAHELRNPLAPIRYASRLVRSTTPPAMLDDVGRMIERQLAHMSRLLDDLLDVSRITRGAIELRTARLDLRSLIETTVESQRAIAQAAGLTIDLELSNDSLQVEGDGARLVQVLENLLTNAIRYTDPGGRITIRSAVDAEWVSVEVRDTGIGIAATKLEEIFDLFNQGERSARSGSGLGIGLTLSRRLAELHHGRLEAFSAGPETGSAFVLRLPKAPEAPALQAPIAAAEKVAVLGASGTRVLVVDDNVDAADALASLLSLAGYETRATYSGPLACDLAETWQPAVVLLDLGLPQMSGLEVAERLRRSPIGRSAYLIAVTGWGGAEDHRKTAAAGFDVHLTKPVDPEVVLQTLAKAGIRAPIDARGSHTPNGAASSRALAHRDAETRDGL